VRWQKLNNCCIIESKGTTSGYKLFLKKFSKRISHHFYSPSEILAEIDIRAGDSVLEIGLPVGFFATALLGKVGDQGAVYIAGPNQDSLEKLSHLTSREKLPSVLC
jgi:ubiquinone/menaquinone biosynthesis C-methylase UbiE